VRSELHDEPVYALDFTAEFSGFSDRDLQQEYFRDDYRNAPPPLSYAMLRSQSDWASAALVVQPRVNPFSTETEYLPEFRYDLPALPVGGGLFLSGSGNAGYLQRRFDEDSGFEDFEAGRGHLRLLANRPIALGPVSFNPYVGTDQAWYSEGRDGPELTRGALLYGADSSVRFYGVYDAESEGLNLHGLRHVIEPRLFYRGVSDPTADPLKIYDFDPADDLAKSNVAGAGLFQKLQTKRRGDDGKEQVADLAGVDLVASGYVDSVEADRLNSGDQLQPFKVNSFVSPTEHLKLWNNLEVDVHGAGVTRTVEGLRLGWPELFSTEFTFTTITGESEREIRASRYLTGRVETVLSEHWRLGLASSYEFERPNQELGQRGFGDSRISLVRDLHCWLVSFDFSVHQKDHGDYSQSVGMTVGSSGQPQNLIKGSDQLILDMPESGIQPWLFRPSEPLGELRVVPPKEPPPGAGDR